MYFSSKKVLLTNIVDKVKNTYLIMDKDKI